MTSNSSSKLEKIKKQIEDLKKENASLKKTLGEYGIIEISEITDIEFICIEQIKMFKEIADKTELDDRQVKNLDTLHKNLRAVRNQDSPKKKLSEEVNVADLLEIVKEDNGR